MKIFTYSQFHLKDKSIPPLAGEGEQKDVAAKQFF